MTQANLQEIDQEMKRVYKATRKLSPKTYRTKDKRG
jgi:hypothetical protein